MLDSIKSNPRPSIYGILALVAYTLQQQPDLVSFLPPNIRGYVLGTAAFICAVKAILAAQYKLTPAQQEAKALNKEKDREIFKEEIKEEVRVIAAEKAAELIESKIIPAQVSTSQEIATK